MSEPLRTRIATTVTKMSNAPCCDSAIHNVHPSDWAFTVADALIAELGLKQQDRYGFHRCVSEWTTDD